MNSIQQTFASIQNMLYSITGVNPEISSYTTMNERLSIEANSKPGADERVKLGVLVIGSGGHTCIPGTDGMPRIAPRNHTAENMSTFKPVPFVLRPVEDDLTLSERNKYCLRKEIKVNGKMYFAYYGYRLTITKESFKVTVTRVTSENGVEEEQLYETDSNNIYPEPVDLPVDGAVVASNVQLRVTAPINIRLDFNAVAEFVQACKIMNDGDETTAVISEMALCTGADRVVPVPGTDGTIQFKESIATQIYCHSADMLALYYNKKEANITIDLGAQIPLISVESIPTIQTIP